MLSKKKIVSSYCVTLFFIFLNAYLVIHNFLLLSFIPFSLALFTIAIYSLDTLFYIATFFTPLSITLSNFYSKKITPDLSLPTEPILFGISILFLLKIINGIKIDKRFISHPITIAIFINTFWIAVTCFTSSLPIISFKFLVARCWLIIPSFFVAFIVFSTIHEIYKFIWIYLLPFTFVIIYTLFEHSGYQFAEHPANWVVKPFYNDHTSYAAILAMFIPVLFGFTIIKTNSLLLKTISFFLLILFLVAIVFSYTRASWVSLVIAIFFLLILIMKIKFKQVLIFCLFGICCAFYFQETIIQKLGQNNKESSDNLTQHVESISNISTDASNKERINRWKCAYRMFKNKPIFGYGPGTYSFNYAPFQYRNEKTIISTNNGDAGNAHNEFLGPLAESGLIGLLSFIFICLTVISTGMRLFYSTLMIEYKILICVLLLGLTTYFAHGLMNNFLDTDKASVPFWGFIAAIVAIDLKHTSIKTRTE